MKNLILNCELLYETLGIEGCVLFELGIKRIIYNIYSFDNVIQCNIFK